MVEEEGDTEGHEERNQVKNHNSQEAVAVPREMEWDSCPYLGKKPHSILDFFFFFFLPFASC